MKTRVVLAALMMITMCGCDKGLGEYVYKDCANVIHTDKECLKNNCLGSKNETVELLGIRGVMFIKTEYLPNELKTFPKLCPHCVTDHQADQLKQIYKGWTEVSQRQSQMQDDAYDGR